ncbi:Probable cytochrome P450 49a1, partial [Gryllus bimaculatus]
RVFVLHSRRPSRCAAAASDELLPVSTWRKTFCSPQGSVAVGRSAEVNQARATSSLGQGGQDTMELTTSTVIYILVALMIPIWFYLQTDPKRKQFVQVINKIPGRLALPVIGNAYEVFTLTRENFFTLIDEDTKKYWPIFRSWNGPLAEVHLQKMALPPQAHHTYLSFQDSGSFPRSFRREEQHSRAEVGEGKTAMGTEINAQEDSHSPYVSAIYAASELTLARMLRPWLHPDFIYSLTQNGKEYKKCLNILHSFTNKVINERKLSFMKKQCVEEESDVLGKKRRRAFLDLLLEASEEGGKLTDEEIREEGHDTTSASLCWTLLLLGNHPDIQERVFEEQSEIFHGSDRLPTTQDIGEMKYLERVIKESLRLYPSVPFIGRTLTEDVQVGEYVLPQGCQVTLHIYHTHRNPKFFPNPDDFNPDNFLPEKMELSTIIYALVALVIPIWIYMQSDPKRKQFVQAINKIPGRFALPVIGNGYENSLQRSKRIQKNSGPYGGPGMDLLQKASELTLGRMLRPWLHSDFIYSLTRDGKKYKQCLNTLHSFTTKVINERKLSLMKKHYIEEEPDGHDTTSASLCWTLFLLGNYPQIQERVFDEQSKIFQGSDRLPTTQDVAEMKYLERVIKESLRLYPSVPFIGRALTEEVQVGEYLLPAATHVTIQIYHVNRNPKYFPNPDEFNPDNFLPEKVQGRHPYAYVPFSAGSRNCIDFFYVIHDITMTYWPRYRSWYGPTPEINFSEADDIEIILRSSVNIKKGMLYHFLHPWLGTGLLTSSERAMRIWLYPDFIYFSTKRGKRFKRSLNILHSFSKKIINDRKQKPIRRNETGETTDDGHDTTSASLVWTLFLLGNHPEVQERVFEEQAAIFQNSDRVPTMQDLTEMKYLERVIKESLREYTFPAGCQVTLHIYNAHRNPKYFPNPDEFNPDNFLPEKVQGRHPYAYKFALQEEKTVLSAIVRNFRVRALDRPADVKMLINLFRICQFAIGLDMDLVTVIIIIVIILVSLTMFWVSDPKRKRMLREVNKLPGPLALPIIGNAYLAFTFNRKNFFYFVDKNSQKYWPIYRIWYAETPEVNMMEADHLEVIFRSSINVKKGMLYDFLHPWLGTGLLTSTGQKWHTHRKLITPTFHFKILETFQDIFTKNSQILVQKLNKEVGNESGFDIFPYITRCTLDIICETAMGVKINAQNDTFSPYVSAVYDISELTSDRMMRIWLYPDFIYYMTKRGKRYLQCLNILHSFSNQVIRTKRRMAFLDLLLEASQGGAVLTDEEIREEVDTFMFEGHDTTSSSLCWTLFLLGNHLEVQERVYEEQDAIFQDSDRLPTMRDLTEMKYLEQVIKESLRLYPSVPFITRTLVEDVQIEEYNFPAGCEVSIHIYHAHRNPKYFPNPDEFNPDNFLPEKVQGRHPYAYVPFSAGSRNCIGKAFQFLRTLYGSVCHLVNWFPFEIGVFDILQISLKNILETKKGFSYSYFARLTYPCSMNIFGYSIENLQNQRTDQTFFFFLHNSAQKLRFNTEKVNMNIVLIVFT